MSRATWLPALTLAAALAPSPANACDCVSLGWSFVAPADGATSVPTNARVWTGRRRAELRLERDDGSPVAAAVREVTAFDAVLRVLVPAAPLEPGATYHGYADAERLTSFRVGSAVDAEPPPVPEIVGRGEVAEGGGFFDFGPSDSCGDVDVRLLSLDLEDRGVVTVVDLDRTASLEPAGPGGAVSTMAFEDTLFIGRGICTANWDETGSVGVRLGAFDVAGNFSGWSEDSEERIPEGGCGCASTRIGGGAWPALLLVLILALRRRR